VIYNLQAQDNKVKADTIKTVWLNGVTPFVDFASLISSSISNGETYSMEGGVQVAIKHKYFPVFEIGFAGADKISNNNITFNTNAFFGRVGIDFNLSKTKKDTNPTNNLFFGGIRLGYTNFNYNITNALIKDSYWGGEESLSFNNQNATKIWYELVGGIRVEVFKNIFMGWTVRNKNLLGSDAVGAVFPWYIPGYGINTSSNWTLNYIVGYRF
jgi:hypothetical protein